MGFIIILHFRRHLRNISPTPKHRHFRLIDLGHDLILDCEDVHSASAKIYSCGPIIFSMTQIVLSEYHMRKPVELAEKRVGLSSSTEASGSKPRRNTKKYRISQPSSSNKKINKVEAQPRIAKSSLNNTNRVSKISHGALDLGSTRFEDMKNSKLNKCYWKFVAKIVLIGSKQQLVLMLFSRSARRGIIVMIMVSGFDIGFALI
ncbi:hypothetical protein Tco_0844189 [Tanacetum coccineum]